jgi:hypothetical protein
MLPETLYLPSPGGDGVAGEARQNETGFATP